MDYSLLRELIETNRGKTSFGRFGHGRSEEWIEMAQNRLGVRFPPSYTWWLSNYGGGEVNGDEIFSVYGLDFDSVVGGDVVYINELNRERGISTRDELVIQENDQGETYYINLKQVGVTGESPVYVEPGKIKYAETFGEFLALKLIE